MFRVDLINDPRTNLARNCFKFLDNKLDLSGKKQSRAEYMHSNFKVKGQDNLYTELKDHHAAGTSK